MTGISELQTVFGNVGQTNGSDEVAAKTRTAAATSNVVATPDRSVVSTTAGALSQAMAAPDVRADKVAQLQAAIASGSYQVSSSDVAAKLIDSMLGKG